MHANVINREVRILQANIKKINEARHAMHNDMALADFHFILSQEPSYFPSEGEMVLQLTVEILGATPACLGAVD